MKFKQQQNGLVVYRATLIIKSLAILASLLLALVLQDRRGQEMMLWPTIAVVVMLMVFGTNWFERRLGAGFFPLAIGVAIVFQTIELSLHHAANPILVTAQANPLTSFGAIEPFVFLLVPVALAAWRYGTRGAFLAVGGTALLYIGMTAIVGNLGQVNLVELTTHLLILAVVGGAAVLLSMRDRVHHAASGAADHEPVSELAIDRDARDNLVILLSDLDARVDALYDQFGDLSDAHALELTQLKLATADALAMVAIPRRAAPLCSKGLIEALHEYVDGFRQRTGVPVALQLKLDPDSLEPEQAETALKIVEEALDGVASRACAQASVSLLCSGSHVALSVHGAGADGPPNDGAARANELRLLSLRRRAESVGGILCVSQQPQQGTTVACVFPRTTTHA